MPGETPGPYRNQGMLRCQTVHARACPTAGAGGQSRLPDLRRTRRAGCRRQPSFLAIPTLAALQAPTSEVDSRILVRAAADSRARSCTIVRDYRALSCTIVHYRALSCTIVRDYRALSCTIVRYRALSCTIVHYRGRIVHYRARSAGFRSFPGRARALAGPRGPCRGLPAIAARIP